MLVVSKLPRLGLNSYQVQIVPFIADGLMIFLFVQFFKDLPGQRIEAARVEGATNWQIYRRIVMPLSGPILATAAILKFLVMYNQYLWPLIVVQDQSYRPVMVGLQYFFELNRAWGEIRAYVSLITIPVLAFYLYLQRAFIASSASTGLKADGTFRSWQTGLGQLVCPRWRSLARLCAAGRSRAWRAGASAFQRHHGPCNLA